MYVHYNTFVKKLMLRKIATCLLYLLYGNCQPLVIINQVNACFLDDKDLNWSTQVFPYKPSNKENSSDVLCCNFNINYSNCSLEYCHCSVEKQIDCFINDNLNRL